MRIKLPFRRRHKYLTPQWMMVVGGDDGMDRMAVEGGWLVRTKVKEQRIEYDASGSSRYSDDFYVHLVFVPDKKHRWLT